MLGKKLYKTSMLSIFKLIILMVVLFFFNDLILDTYTYEKFQAVGRFKILDAIEYHYRYPYEFFTFVCLIVIPAIYYAFIRGVRFQEKGFSFNRGLPFMNKEISYDEVLTYKLLHPKHVISVHTKSGDVYIVSDDNVERAVAILDQHNIQGDLAGDEYVKLITNVKKFIFVVLTFTLVVFVIKKLGFFPR